MPTSPRRRAIRDPVGRDPWREGFRDVAGGRSHDRWQPAVDVFETAEAVVVRVELPGVRGADIRVKVEGERIRITGERKVPARSDLKRLLRMEIAFGPFERIVAIGTPFDRERVVAHLEDGFLEITLPVKPPVQRRVEVEEG